MNDPLKTDGARLDKQIERAEIHRELGESPWVGRLVSAELLH